MIDCELWTDDGYEWAAGDIRFIRLRTSCTLRHRHDLKSTNASCDRGDIASCWHCSNLASSLARSLLAMADQAQRLYRAGMELYAAKRYDEALSAFDRVRGAGDAGEMRSKADDRQLALATSRGRRWMLRRRL